ncbi:GlxA family transcriptional regulator [Variovorax ginsengisoli]|uniref:Helix-turn-helix domain-containing protein n=1 Tax=Variovorax ginsengisoli TaxID=363844 RepID=A0ABT8SD80_9BURK|nr:helix-turn-helix domain-containing protein [Variovorax ginsengisoli]MDN8617707.1 helix-turn-helix domain-containing protein [Variovorax ginsengisoli]MDO1536877.1 helix-turn-helix domain-containing protein [Variovorax ginsengisoli]
MPRAAILAFDGCYASSLGGFADVLQVANAHLRRQQGASAALFEWRFVSLSGEAIAASNGLQMPTHKIGAREHYDLVFVPSLHYAGHRKFDQLLKGQPSTCAWLASQWRRGAWLAANCTGTFILAQTGLLDDRIATTTWWLERQFRTRFPRVDLQMRPVLTEVDRLLCAGASASYLLQAIRVVERIAGPAIASQCAKSMLIDVSQTSQTPYLPLLADIAHTDALVHRAQHWLQRNMSRPIRIAELAGELAVSERTLIRRFNAVLDQSPLTYLQHLRIDSARALLEASDLGVDQIAVQVGYNDPSSFSRLFRERMGLSPGAYRNRFRSLDPDRLGSA